MMKKSLLATVAAAALIAGPAFAQKQEAPAGDVKGAAPPPAAIQRAPAEKSAPSVGFESKNPARSETTGQASPSGRPTGDSDIKAAPGGRSGSDVRSGTNDTPAGPKAGRDADTKPGGKATGGADSQADVKSPGGSVALSTEQKAKIRTSVLTANAPRVTNVNFSINVGTVVPRTVRLVAVPAPLIEIHPTWRGFLYFVHGDEIIIVEPGTLRIVAVIDV